MRAVFARLGTGLLLAAGVAASALAVPATSATAVTTAAALPAGDSPPGFYYGTDSLPVTVNGKGPYTNPSVIGGSYGGFVGMAGNWARTLGCSTGNFLNWVAANSAEANTNYTKYHIGIGTAVYWYMGGPGVDPNWNGTAAEASKWGARQAAWTLTAMKARAVTYPVIWADIEMPGIAPAPDNGWNAHYSSPCSGVVLQAHTPANVDRAEFNGYANYITSHSNYKVGVYSNAATWATIFGTGSASSIPNTYEWTYWPETANLSGRAPVGWCLRGTSTCAQFFGGQSASSKYALMWQWSGGGGVLNSLFTDFDQIDVARVR